MVSRKSPAVDTVNVSDETLEQTPGRVLTFLRAVGNTQAIRLALAGVGYDQSEHERGWSLLHAVSGYVPAAPVSTVDGEVAQAVAELDALDEKLHRRIDASLKHRFPEVREQLLRGLEPGRGGESVVYVRNLLDRLDALEKQGAKAPLALLAQRSVTPAYRRSLAALVKTAERYHPPVTPPAEDEGYATNLRALRAWYEEWSELARAELSRKDYLQRLGLARRKRSSRNASPAPVGPTPT